MVAFGFHLISKSNYVREYGIFHSYFLVHYNFIHKQRPQREKINIFRFTFTVNIQLEGTVIFMHALSL